MFHPSWATALRGVFYGLLSAPLNGGAYAAKAPCLSVTPGIVGAMHRIARENAILQSNQDKLARIGGK
jgi:hypothetical protein